MIDRKRIEWIENVVNLTNDTWSETATGLLSAYHNCKYCNDKLVSMIEQELLSEIEWAEDNLIVVKKSELREVTWLEVEVING